MHTSKTLWMFCSTGTIPESIFHVLCSLDCNYPNLSVAAVHASAVSISTEYCHNYGQKPSRNLPEGMVPSWRGVMRIGDEPPSFSATSHDSGLAQQFSARSVDDGWNMCCWRELEGSEGKALARWWLPESLGTKQAFLEVKCVPCPMRWLGSWLISRGNSYRVSAVHHCRFLLRGSHLYLITST